MHKKKKKPRHYRFSYFYVENFAQLGMFNLKVILHKLIN